MASSSGLVLFFASGIFGLQWISFLFSAWLQTEKFFDLLGSITFFLTAAASLAVGGYLFERQVMVTTLVSVWSVRLGTFLLMRVLKAGKDRRFDGVRDDPVMLFVFWTIQAIWVTMVMLPVVLLNFSPLNPPWLSPTDVIGLLLWGFGFLVESVADYQKFLFKEDEENEDKWIDTGLWRYCRHPNYFGEIVLWWGVFLVTVAGLQGMQLAVGVLSPIYLTCQLIYLSGVSILEKSADEKWGSDPNYQLYKQNTPCLFPWPVSKSHKD